MIHFPRWKIILVLLICLVGIGFAAPNFLPAKWFAEDKRVNLGLDLRGGSYLLLEVGIDEYVREQYQTTVDDIRFAMREARLRYTNLRSTGDSVLFSLLNQDDFEKAEESIREISRDFAVEQDGAKVRVAYNEDALKTLRDQVLNQSIEIVRKRVDETGTREPIIQRQGDERILLQVPGLDDPERLKNLLGRTAKMTFHLMDDRDPYPAGPKGVLPGHKLLKSWSGETDENGNAQERYYIIKKKVIISGDMLVSANTSFDQGQPVVSFRFNNQGARKFADITKKNTNKPFAIVLDNEVISAPVIREPILGGSGMISGGFSVQSANDLALLLRAGALPAPLKVLEERTVGPSLGQDSIDAGTMAAIVGIILVLIFMVMNYGLFGVFSNVALAINLILVVAALSFFQATLTLPGIAGIVLTMGMAVDANVLIFERIKEEMAIGRTPISAVDQGFGHAFKTITDSNVTTLIATLLLFIFGSGPVKGFAVTLSIGILASMFSAIMLTRMFVVVWLRRTKPKSIPL